ADPDLSPAALPVTRPAPRTPQATASDSPRDSDANQSADSTHVELRRNPIDSLPGLRIAGTPGRIGFCVMEDQMRRLVLTALVLTAALVEVGCIVPIYSSSRDVRARQLIYVSEGFRHIPEIWERIWGLDMPDVATPYRTHGGVI